MSEDAIRELARTRLGFKRLRPGQLRAVVAASGGRDVLAVLPTGGGKSAIYELAGLLRDGPTVISTRSSPRPRGRPRSTASVIPTPSSSYPRSN